ncbi:hypothetical protein PQX77_017442 [Marasmius sp. AFHP31]|nr:hypothetical protein PQX77_017442 [Marasmius sp. AFHP31]
MSSTEPLSDSASKCSREESPNPSIKKQKALTSQHDGGTDDDNGAGMTDNQNPPESHQAQMQRRHAKGRLKALEEAIEKDDYGPMDSKVYFKLIAALEALIEVQEEVQEVYDLMTDNDFYRDNTMQTFLTKERRLRIESQFHKSAACKREDLPFKEPLPPLIGGSSGSKASKPFRPGCGEEENDQPKLWTEHHNMCKASQVLSAVDTDTYVQLPVE